ncbi:hypothetical protein FisN_1Lu397 [Fistulifera solaris]|uniref:Uncharacterized protein n=1 Tax=Fistulifera solaris TaxID=1519565 RepID=A0A1Z5K3W7_FISSO|nr:hypothetical protein FisN_1Lu397 [Fistulifera solaris]|eukprot:GAX20943.1 hypothetical protein FisN_1Lu397 [Fistulifera solaris]
MNESSFDDKETGDNDSSVFSDASTNMLNLSIDARAALDEHLRHVAKFGIDDSHYENDNKQDFSFESYQKDPRDALWQRLVDPNYSNNTTKDATHLLSHDLMRLISKASFAQSVVGHSQDVETVNDQSSDYFNSSRVYLLKTPERNRSQRSNAVTCRNDEDVADEFFITSESPVERSRDYANDQCLDSENAKIDASPSVGMPRNDPSFLCSAVDFSRISDDGIGDPAECTSPVTPFTSRVREGQFKSEKSGSQQAKECRQPNHTVSSPSWRSSKQTPSTSQRKGIPALDPTNQSFGVFKRRSPPSTPQFLRSEDVPDFAANLTLSPIGSHSRQNTPSFKLPHSPAQPHQNHSRSPTSPHDDHISSLAAYCSASKCAPSDDHSTPHNSPPLKQRNGNGLSELNYGQDSPESASSDFLLRDRRRFRTVVPTRVFFTDADDIPEHEDSFTIPPKGDALRSDPKTTQNV